jgi:hypothetical protein
MQLNYIFTPKLSLQLTQLEPKNQGCKLAGGFWSKETGASPPVPDDLAPFTQTCISHF